MAELEDVPRDDVIKHNIQAFLPYICDCVKATDLLVHLHYYTREQRKDIFRLCGQNNVRGMQKAMEVLMHEVEDRGRFTTFRNAIEDSDYPKIVKMMDGEKVASDENCRKLVDLFSKEIIRRLNPEDLLPILVSEGVLSGYDADEVRAEERNHGKGRACWVLLFHLPNRVENWFRILMDAFVDYEYSDIAEILEPDLYQKIKLQREEAIKASADLEKAEDIRENVLTDKGEVESLLNGMNELNVDEHPSCKLLEAHDDTEETFRNEGVDEFEDSLTEVKRMNNDRKQNVAGKHMERQNGEGAVSEETLAEQEQDQMTSVNLVYDNNLDVSNEADAKEADDTNDEVLDFGSLLIDNQAVAMTATERGSRDPLENLNLDRGVGDRNMIAMALNDLDNEREQNPQDEIEYNILTDVDEVETADEDFELREYQKELAKEGSEGENVIVMAPTNTGKTRVACRIMQVHLRRQKNSGKIGKVIFLVENEALAFQQGKVCAELLPAYRTKVISGSVQRDKKQYLRDFLERRDILVVTAQVLLNALKQKEIDSITKFSMIVFDECHHTDNEHRFNEIMSSYMDLKLRQNIDAEHLPQVVGLTASLGVGGQTNEAAAMLHMKGLLANLDAKFLNTVRKNIKELRHFENNPIEKIVAAKKRANDRYRNALLDIMDIIDEYMIAHQSMQNLGKHDKFIKESCRVPASRGTEQFQQWLSDFKKAIAKLRSDDIRRMMNPCRRHLEVYNKALLIHADARIKDAEKILEAFMEIEKQINPKNDTDVFLLELYEGLERKDFSDEPENPKLVKMQEIVMRIFDKNADARGIIFVKTRELAVALVNWMKETNPLDTLHASDFVGQAASKAEGGMTKCGQKDVLEYFKGGRHKIIVATSVAEEGLDITKCNLVIRYEHVTNEIVRLQSRGRARMQDSRYYVLTEEDSWIVAKEEKNALLEKVMNSIVPKLQADIEDHPNLWEKELRDIQEAQKSLEEGKEKQRKAKMTKDEQEFQCLNCGNFICFLSDIRKIQGAHHVVVDEGVLQRLVAERSPQPSFIDDELEFGGVIYCGNEDCQSELGGVCVYKHAVFPLLRIKQFRVVDKNNKGNTFKQWKKANFEVEPFTIDDLRHVVERRRGIE